MSTAFLSVFVHPVEAQQNAELTKALDERAAQIRPMLRDEPFCVIPPITDREFWNARAAEPAFQKIVQNAEKSLEKPVPQVPEELYLEFSKNQNRSHYQHAYSVRNAPLSELVIAECVENQGRFLPRIEEHLQAYFGDRSWTLPAHDAGLKSFNGDPIVDLVASNTGFRLAIIDRTLGEKLSPEVRDQLDKQLEQRIFRWFRYHARLGRFWWLNTKNNWNAVCLCGVLGAALVHLDSLDERAWFIAAADHFFCNFVRGCGMEGYCSEGLSYWNYGFQNAIILTEMIRRVTHDQLRLLDQPELREFAMYGFRVNVQSGVNLCCADCSPSSQPDRAMLKYLNRYYDFHFRGIDQLPLSLERDFIAYGFFRDAVLPPWKDQPTDGATDEAAETQPIEKPLPSEENRTWFPMAQVLIARPGMEPASEQAAQFPVAKPGLGVAMKGGNNDEMHNHNDLGAYMVVFQGELLVADVGAETYTGRTFSSQRYVSDVLNSWGHAVPVAAGKLQDTGAKAAAKVLRTEFTDERDTLELDLRAAYSVEACQKLVRTFVYDRTGSTSFHVTDEVEFSEPQTFEVGLPVRTPWRQEGQTLLLGEGAKQITAVSEVSLFDEASGTWQVSDSWHVTNSPFTADFYGQKIFRRLGIVLDQPVKKARVKLSYNPQK